MARFHQSLARLRGEAGFPTPYAFYHRNGGRRVFPFSFPYYLKLERGLGLPRPEWIPRLLALLRIPPQRDHYRAFLADFLRELCGGEEIYQAVVAPLLAPAAAAGGQPQALKRLVSEQAYHLTPAQYRAVVSSEASYWVFECLVNDRKGLSVAELGQALGLPTARLASALRRLAAAKLLRRTAGGRFVSPLACRFYVFPRHHPGAEADRTRLRGYVEAMAGRRGRELMHAGITIRAEEGAMRNAMLGLSEAMEAASAYSCYERGDGTGLFLIEGRVRRILPY